MLAARPSKAGSLSVPAWYLSDQRPRPTVRSATQASSRVVIILRVASAEVTFDRTEVQNGHGSRKEGLTGALAAGTQQVRRMSCCGGQLRADEGGASRAVVKHEVMTG
jgi:hypothetical protein